MTFNNSLILLCRKKENKLKTKLRVSKASFRKRQKCALLPGNAYSSPTYSNSRQVLSKIINPMQPLVERTY